MERRSRKPFIAPCGMQGYWKNICIPQFARYVVKETIKEINDHDSVCQKKTQDLKPTSSSSEVGHLRRNFRSTETAIICLKVRLRTNILSILHSSGLILSTAYLPNRGWNGEELRWMYMPASQHDRDVELHVKAWATRKKTAVHVSSKVEDRIVI
jgi:hypothetical protein